MPNSIEKIYQFSLTTKSIETSLNIQAFRISVSDSIYSLCPKVTVSTDDIFGMVLESRMNILGQTMTLRMNDGSNESSWPITCTVYEMPNSYSGEGLGGSLNIDFKHSVKFSSLESKVWTDQSPVDIFKDIITKTNQQFNSFNKSTQQQPVVEIDTTSQCVNYPLIFNPNYDNEKFVDTILVPLAVDGSIAINPFFAYIDTENKAHFESFKNILDKSPCKTLILGKSIDPETNSTAITGAQNFSQDYNKIIDFIDESLVYLNEKNQVTSQDISLSKTITPLALMKDSSGSTLLSPENYNRLIDVNEEIGQLNYKYRKGMLIDKLIVSTLMDLSLCAGKTIDLEIYLNTGDFTPSTSYSGKYVIEASEHVWDPKNMIGYTNLLVGRSSMEVMDKEFYQ